MLRLALAVLVAGVLAGCGAAPPPPATAPAHASPTLTSAASAPPAGAPARQAAAGSNPRVTPVASSPAAKSSPALPPELPPPSSTSNFHVASDADMAAAARANQASQQAIEATLK